MTSELSGRGVQIDIADLSERPRCAIREFDRDVLVKRDGIKRCRSCVQGSSHLLMQPAIDVCDSGFRGRESKLRDN